MITRAMFQPAMFSREVGIILDTIEEGIHVVNKDGITVLYNRRAAESITDLEQSTA